MKAKHIIGGLALVGAAAAAAAIVALKVKEAQTEPEEPILLDLDGDGVTDVILEDLDGDDLDRVIEATAPLMGKTVAAATAMAERQAKEPVSH